MQVEHRFSSNCWSSCLYNPDKMMRAQLKFPEWSQLALRVARALLGCVPPSWKCYLFTSKHWKRSLALSNSTSADSMFRFLVFQLFLAPMHYPTTPPRTIPFNFPHPLKLWTSCQAFTNLLGTFERLLPKIPFQLRSQSPLWTILQRQYIKLTPYS